MEYCSRTIWLICRHFVAGFAASGLGAGSPLGVAARETLPMLRVRPPWPDTPRAPFFDARAVVKSALASICGNWSERARPRLARAASIRATAASDHLQARARDSTAQAATASAGVRHVLRHLRNGQNRETVATGCVFALRELSCRGSLSFRFLTSVNPIYRPVKIINYAVRL